MTPELVKTAYIDIKPEALWAWLTEKEKLAKWFHPAEVDLKEGQDYTLLCQTEDGETKPLIWGHVVTANFPNELVYTFNIPPLQGVETTVRFRLEQYGEGTQLTLVHRGFDANVENTPLALLMALDSGWDEHLNRLRNCNAMD